MTGVLVGGYLAAITVANLSVAHFGPRAIIVNAFLLIGFDLTVRDRLHDLWREHRAVKMAALILAGSALSYALGAGRIAVASAVAFGAAATADALVYHAARRWPWLARANTSNVVSATVDSLVFPTLAFGAFMPFITLGQIAAKVLGGFVYSLAFWRARTREA